MDMFTTQQLIDLANQIIFDVAAGKITSVTEGYRTETAPIIADRLREADYHELADKFLQSTAELPTT